MKQLKIWQLISWLLLSISSFAQLRLGEATFSNFSAVSLEKAATAGVGFRSLSFLEDVGGVAFDKVAIPVTGLDVTSLQLQYDPGANNGSRFSVVINGHADIAPIYDWELIPIAKFANSEHTACFTLAGRLENAKDEENLRGGDRILNYHSELQNTLLGLRLFQVDILIFMPEISTDLPKLDGEYLLGAGEKAPNIEANQQGFTRFASNLGDAEYYSYLICDQHRSITFRERNDTLLLTGQPYYYFWRYSSDNKAEPVNDLNTTLSDKPSLFRAINPAVWNAAVTTMRYAAFFRYCKTHFPDQWNSFLAQVSRVPIQPYVQTPTVLHPFGN
jgi:hypothetical protein